MANLATLWETRYLASACWQELCVCVCVCLFVYMHVGVGRATLTVHDVVYRY